MPKPKNGVAERRFRTLLDTTRAMLTAAGMSDEYWGMAFKHATTIHNVSPTQALGGEAPFTILCGRPFDVNQLKVFGAKAYVHVPKASRHKLGKRARTGIYVGFDHESQSHQVWVPQTKQMVNTIHVKFNEVQTNDITQSLEAARETRRYTELTPTVSEENALHAASDKQSRICASAAGENATNTSSAQTPHDGDAPDVDTALQSDEKEQWLAAITEEASALEANHVYEVVRADQIPKGAKLLPSKFVLKRKRDPKRNCAKVQGTAGCERVFAETWNRLPRNVRSNNEQDCSSHHACNECSRRHVHAAAGYCDGVSLCGNRHGPRLRQASTHYGSVQQR